jgi:hypothetical protein
MVKVGSAPRAVVGCHDEGRGGTHRPELQAATRAVRGVGSAAERPRRERIALERIKAGKELSKAALEAIVSREWAKWVKGALVITEAGEKALAEQSGTA